MLLKSLQLAVRRSLHSQNATTQAAIDRLHAWPDSEAGERAARQVETQLFFDPDLAESARRVQRSLRRLWRSGRILACLLVCSLPALANAAAPPAADHSQFERTAPAVMASSTSVGRSKQAISPLVIETEQDDPCYPDKCGDP